jgi:hypothetical protein
MFRLRGNNMAFFGRFSIKMSDAFDGKIIRFSSTGCEDNLLG